MSPQLRPSVTRSPRTMIAVVPLLSALCLFASPTRAGAQGQLLTDPGLNSGSQPLLPFTNSTLQRWMQENASLVVGSQNGVTPFEGDGMLAIRRTSLSVSDARQRIDVSAFATAIDAGLATATACARINASAAGVSGGINLFALDSSQLTLQTSSGGFALDGDSSTWEPSFTSSALPPGTRFIEARFSFSNSSLTFNRVAYCDDAALSLSTTGTVTGACNVGGLPNQALGQARLRRTSAGGLVVSNLGSSGQDGVRISVGNAQGATTQMDLDPGATPVGARIRSHSTWSFGGVSGQSGGHIDMIRTANGYDAAPDFSSAGATTFSVTIRRRGQLVGRWTGLSGPVPILQNAPNRITCTTVVTTFNSQVIGWDTKWTFDGNGTTFVILQDALDGDSICIAPDIAPLAVGASLESLELTAVNQPAFTIESQSLVVDGHSVTARGNANMTGSQGFAVISNLGSSGQDGVRLRRRSARERAATVGLRVPPSQPTGSKLRIEATGRINGAIADVGALDIVRMANGAKQIDADYGPVGSTSFIVEILNAGSRVSLIRNHTGTIAFVNEWPSECGKRDEWDGHGTSCLVCCYAIPVVISVPGHPLAAGDELRILAEGATPVAGIDSLSLLGTNLSSITVNSASSEPSYSTFGLGCGSPNPLLLLPNANTDPRIGSSLEVELVGIGPGAALVVGLFSTASTTVPLDILGAAGCSLLNNILASQPLPPGFPTATWSIPIPNDPGLIGFEIFQQGAVAEPGVNPLGIRTSNIGRGIVRG